MTRASSSGRRRLLGQVDVQDRGAPPAPRRRRSCAKRADVLQRVFHFIVHPVAGRERLGPVGREPWRRRPRRRSWARSDLVDALAPGPGGPGQPASRARRGIDVRRRRRPAAAGSGRTAGPARIRSSAPRSRCDCGVEGLAQFLLDAQADGRGVAVARQEDEGGHEPAVDVRRGGTAGCGAAPAAAGCRWPSRPGRGISIWNSSSRG